ncbi:6787_t:CDS:2, partial [Gigaspora rosea]
KQFDISTESSVDIQLESPTSVLSNSTYITDDGFAEKDSQEFGKYIIKQNGLVKEDKISFSDEELRIDDDDDLPTEKEALKSFFDHWIK